jgi:hypothetical protein
MNPVVHGTAACQTLAGERSSLALAGQMELLIYVAVICTQAAECAY